MLKIFGTLAHYVERQLPHAMQTQFQLQIQHVVVLCRLTFKVRKSVFIETYALLIKYVE